MDDESVLNIIHKHLVLPYSGHVFNGWSMIFITSKSDSHSHKCLTVVLLCTPYSTKVWEQYPNNSCVRAMTGDSGATQRAGTLPPSRMTYFDALYSELCIAARLTLVSC